MYTPLTKRSRNGLTLLALRHPQGVTALLTSHTPPTSVTTLLTSLTHPQGVTTLLTSLTHPQGVTTLLTSLTPPTGRYDSSSSSIARCGKAFLFSPVVSVQFPCTIA